MSDEASFPAGPPAPLSYRDRALALARSIETGDKAPRTFVHPHRYKQHNLMLPDGLGGISGVLDSQPPGFFKFRVVRAIQDGNWTASHAVADFFGPKVIMDVHRFEDSLIVEHWDNIQEGDSRTTNASGHTMIDGPTEISDLERTAANKQVVADLIGSLIRKSSHAHNVFNNDQLIEHAAHSCDGAAHFLRHAGIGSTTASSVDFRRMHMLIGEGNFVLSLCEGSAYGREAGLYDLFRVANAKVVEHWSVVEAIPPREDWQNGNGKF